ncbi:hypothetical protein F0562_022121 [Nyssa sinensis]|uniref:RNase H type-1 domain-containing protein n=1 Tax=Nyssa sinensis TaxID=561372 RepID=A0A5J5BMZ2_9ASTE|nr:hypothetical protein F0562_022121 [Nyssa sinensis]
MDEDMGQLNEELWSILLHLLTKFWTEVMLGTQAQAIWAPPSFPRSSLFTTTGEGGIGAIVRNDHGEFMAAMAKKVEFAGSAEHADILAIYEGLRFCYEMGIKGPVVESDAQGVIQALK